LRDGLRSRDPKFLVWWHSLAPEQQEYARPLLRRFGSDMLSIAAEIAAHEALVDEGLDDGAGSLKASATSTRSAGPAKVTPITSRRGRLIDGAATSGPQFIHTQSQQSNIQTTRLIDEQVRLDRLVDVLRAYGCYMADVFVGQHAEGLETMERAIAEFQELETHHPEQLVGVVARGAFLKKELHLAMMQRIGRLIQCGLCGQVQKYVMVQPPAPDVQEAR
jgi:hypothetical protein